MVRLKGRELREKVGISDNNAWEGHSRRGFKKVRMREFRGECQSEDVRERHRDQAGARRAEDGKRHLTRI